MANISDPLDINMLQGGASAAGVPRPPTNFGELADQVARQVTTSMGITKDRAQRLSKS